MTKEQDDLIVRLVEEHGEKLMQAALRYTGNMNLAEDLVQETMLTACCKITTLIEHENLKGWLYKTLWNLATREMNKAYHSEVPLNMDYIEGSSGIELPMEYFLPKGLDDKEREIILMRIDREMCYAEIAEAKGMKESACRQQLSRAVRKCRDLMEKEADEPLAKKGTSHCHKTQIPSDI